MLWMLSQIIKPLTASVFILVRNSLNEDFCYGHTKLIRFMHNSLRISLTGVKLAALTGIITRICILVISGSR